eukprot:11774049-Prorocentrum_lima.AAC.1
MFLHLVSSKNQLRHDMRPETTAMSVGISSVVAARETKTLHKVRKSSVLGLQVNGAVGHGNELGRRVSINPIQIT